jgi:glycosyltransferase involved in cell wall biosynthesis
MRFLMATTFYGQWSFGGDARMVHQLAHALAERGHDVTVAHSVASHRLLAPESPPPPVRAERREGPVRLVALDAGLGAAAPLSTYVTGRPALLRRRFARLLAEGHDVVHFHNPSLLGAPGVFRMGHAVKLATLHDFWLVCPMHVFMRNGRELCERPSCVRCTIAHRRPPQPWRHTGLLARSLRSLDALLAPSHSTAELHGSLREHVAIEMLPNFLDRDPGNGARPAAAARPYFLSAGRLEPLKGVDRLIDTFAKRPREDLLIAGTGTLEGRLRQRAAELPNVRLLGHVERDELDRLYRGALAVLLPTIGHESCPLVLLEAHARGVPVIASDHGALRELVTGGGGGLLFHDGPELDAALDRVAADAGLRATLGRRARAAYLGSWTVERHIDAYFEIIERRAAVSRA